MSSCGSLFLTGTDSGVAEVAGPLGSPFPDSSCFVSSDSMGVLPELLLPDMTSIGTRMLGRFEKGQRSAFNNSEEVDASERGEELIQEFF